MFFYRIKNAVNAWFPFFLIKRVKQVLKKARTGELDEVKKSLV